MVRCIIIFMAFIEVVATKLPHILFIVADDFGYNDVGYHQNQKSSANPNGYPTTNQAAGIMKTPTIDLLAAEGVKLENYYVQPLCSPTRSTIMTGRYASHTGIGPNVDRIDYPYGVPAQEVFFPERLKARGYTNHMVGKWHLGACDKRYHPTYRGFDSYIGYLAGGQGYYNQRGDRNSTCPNELGPCLGHTFSRNYSSIFFANECVKRIQQHDREKPLFLYLAFQSVHSPYDEPPIDVNQTFPEIYNFQRRIYAGMVMMMDDAIQKVVTALKDTRMWNDTVLVFTTDNGGIDAGSNYPLRGTKTFNWEGGIKAVGFVRGTNNPRLAPLPANTTCHALMHTTDWFPTLVEGLAGGERGENTLPLDGYNQWEVLRGRETTKRNTIFHQVPVGATPIKTDRMNRHGEPIYTTSMCLHWVDNRTLPCSSFGATGAAIRHGDYKLLITHPGDAFWGDTSTPDNAYQYAPGGRYPNGSQVFIPRTNDSSPKPFKGRFYLFNIAHDPTETHNLALTMPDKLAYMLQVYNEYAETAKPALDWRWGFTDPSHTNNPSISDHMASSESRHLEEDTMTCTGPFLRSDYCSYGHEWECYVMNNNLEGYDLGKEVHVKNGTVECQSRCWTTEGCEFWVLVDRYRCQLKYKSGNIAPCKNCVFGPKSCPE